jgi:hypothetical protein
MDQNARLNHMSPAKRANYNYPHSNEPLRCKCNPSTRIILLADLKYWANDAGSPKLYWMTGMAGTGKTTIAYSVCDALQRAHQLGASFFCSRLLPDCSDMVKILPTIAYQLARFSPPFQSALYEALGHLSDISRYGMHEQFNSLIKEPLLASWQAMPTNVVVVIDALDECSDASGTKLMLDILFHHATQLPIKFFVTSRPDSATSDRILSKNNHSRPVIVLHEIEKSMVQADIESYLRNELAGISPPPSADQICQIAERADYLFANAAAAVRFICNGGIPTHSHMRLSTMLHTKMTKQPVSGKKLGDLAGDIPPYSKEVLEVSRPPVQHSSNHFISAASESPFPSLTRICSSDTPGISKILASSFLAMNNTCTTPAVIEGTMVRPSSRIRFLTLYFAEI